MFGSVVTFDDIPIQNQIIEVLSRDAVINIKPLPTEEADVWMDSVQMVPTRDVDTLAMQLEMLDPYDLSSRYLSECTDKDFYVE